MLGAKLGVFENGIQWWLGDWWHYGAHAYGARKAKVKAKGAFPYAFPTLMNWGWVAGKVATSLRREALSFSSMLKSLGSTSAVCEMVAPFGKPMQVGQHRRALSLCVPAAPFHVDWRRSA